MDEDLRIRDEILLAILPNVAFDGWTERVVKDGVRDAGFSDDMAFRAFPGGIPEIIRHWSDYGDRRLREEMSALDLAGVPLAERLATAIRLRISVYAPHKESVRRTIAHLVLPAHAGTAARNLAQTVNAIWYAAGDRSADVSFYSRRAILLPIYVAAVLYWLDDESDGSAETWQFVARRIDDVMRAPKLKATLRAPMNALADSARVLTQAAGQVLGSRPAVRGGRGSMR